MWTKMKRCVVRRSLWRKGIILACFMLNVFTTYVLLNTEAETTSSTNEKLISNNFYDDEPPACVWPFLEKTHPSIEKWMLVPKDTHCIQPDPKFVQFDDDRNIYLLDDRVKCYYRAIRGALYPKSESLAFGALFRITKNKTKVGLKQFEVSCWAKDATMQHLTNEIYRTAYMQIAPLDRKFKSVNQDRLSVDIVVLDSVSLNQFRRHMPKTHEYIKNELGFLIFEKPGKVGDNTLPNMVALLSGLKILEKEYTKSDNITTDFLSGKPVEFDEDIRFIWEDFAAQDCVTMLNSDPVHKGYGFGFYPKKLAHGFRRPPTDYYFRPFYHYFNVHPDFYFNLTSRQAGCHGHRIAYESVMRLLKQWFRTYSNTCHFSLTLALQDFTHGLPYGIETLDDVFLEFFTFLNRKGLLGNSVFILMGDHGHRFGEIKYTYYGQIEERTAFFAVFFPKWFRQKYPEVWQVLQENTQELVTHWDIYKTLQAILNREFSTSTKMRFFGRGRSLFQILPQRDCSETEIPPQFCVCLEPKPKLVQLTPAFRRSVQDTLKAGLKSAVLVWNITVYSTNDFVRSNVRHFDAETQLKLLHPRKSHPIAFLWVLAYSHKVNQLFSSHLMYTVNSTLSIVCVSLQPPQRANMSEQVKNLPIC